VGRIIPRCVIIPCPRDLAFGGTFLRPLLLFYMHVHVVHQADVYLYGTTVLKVLFVIACSIWIAIGCGLLLAWIMYNFVPSESLNDVLRRRYIIRVVTIAIAIGTVAAFQVAFHY
jgi:phage-related holin